MVLSDASVSQATYRYARITNDKTHISAADKAFELVKGSLDGNAWLRDAVDPITFNTRLKDDEHTPEGQAFILNLHAAWADYVAVMG